MASSEEYQSAEEDTTEQLPQSDSIWNESRTSFNESSSDESVQDEIVKNESNKDKDFERKVSISLDNRFRNLFSELFDIYDKKIEEVERLKTKKEELEQKLKNNEFSHETKLLSDLCSVCIQVHHVKDDKSNIIGKRCQIIEVLADKRDIEKRILTDQINVLETRNENLAGEIERLTIENRKVKKQLENVQDTLDVVLSSCAARNQTEAPDTMPLPSLSGLPNTVIEQSNQQLRLECGLLNNRINALNKEIVESSKRDVENSKTINELWENVCEEKLRAQKIEKEHERILVEFEKLKEDKSTLELQLSLLFVDDEPYKPPAVQKFPRDQWKWANYSVKEYDSKMPESSKQVQSNLNRWVLPEKKTETIKDNEWNKPVFSDSDEQSEIDKLFKITKRKRLSNTGAVQSRRFDELSVPIYNDQSYLKVETVDINEKSSFYVDEVTAYDNLKKIYPFVDQIEMPRFCNPVDKFKLILSTDCLRIHYSGNSESYRDTASIRANKPIPQNCSVYYFEISVIKKGSTGYICIGLSDSNVVHLNRLPGWEPGSHGYHGDDGNFFSSSGKGQHYGPRFSEGDIIGCGINLVTRTIFFTKNGENLRVAASNVSLDKPLYPIIGIQSDGCIVDVNFGQSKFLYYIEDFIKNNTAPIESTKVNELTELVSDFAALQKEWINSATYTLDNLKNQRKKPSDEKLGLSSIFKIDPCMSDISRQVDNFFANLKKPESTDSVSQNDNNPSPPPNEDFEDAVTYCTAESPEVSEVSENEEYLTNEEDSSDEESIEEEEDLTQDSINEEDFIQSLTNELTQNLTKDSPESSTQTEPLDSIMQQIESELVEHPIEKWDALLEEPKETVSSIDYYTEILGRLQKSKPSTVRQFDKLVEKLDDLQIDSTVQIQEDKNNSLQLASPNPKSLNDSNVEQESSQQKQTLSRASSNGSWDRFSDFSDADLKEF